MYIESIRIENLRTFTKSDISLLFPGGPEDTSRPRAKLPNVNLLLGDNGSGKSTLLQAIALAALGPLADHAGIFPHSLVRSVGSKAKATPIQEGVLEASFELHPQDFPGRRAVPESERCGIKSMVRILKRWESEKILAREPSEPVWEPIFSSSNDAFFFVGYGATRRVEPGESLDIGARESRSTTRAQRVMSLFEDSYSLIPLTYWLPKLRTENPGRYKQAVSLINRLTGSGHYRFQGELERGDYLFKKGATKVRFQALSDGYRAFLGWVADLLYHVCYSCPSGKRLDQTRGIVMVDEVDLHLHPSWQMKVIPTVARDLPNLQFIFTSHSPLVTGSLEWMNIIHMSTSRGMRTTAVHKQECISGLDADQILLSDFFGLESTRAPQMQRRLDEITERARQGDHEAAKLLLLQMSKGMEGRKRGKTLHRERSEVIANLWSFLDLSTKAENEAERRVYEGLVEVWTSPSHSHTNCARCFYDLYKRDPAEAKNVFEAAATFLSTISK